MKLFFGIISLIFVSIGLAAYTPDYFFLPGNFYLHKGDKLDLHLLNGTGLVKQGEDAYSASKTASFMLFDGSKKMDLTKITKDNASPVLSYNLVNTGLILAGMSTTPEINAIPREDFTTYLADQGFDKLNEKVKTSNKLRFTEKTSYYIKTLLLADNPSGNLYEKVLNDEFEIVLKQNPYKKSYGDDMTALVNYKKKPLKDCAVFVFIKSESGNIYSQKLITDASGQVNFTLSREGVYMVRAINMLPGNGGADFETWNASYTFAFSNSNDLPNTYKEFGFGNKH